MRTNGNEQQTRIFGGPAYSPALDRARLTAQIERIRIYMLGVEWRTLGEIKAALERIHAPAIFPETSISANLRNLKKRGYECRLEKRRRAGARGLWEYRLLAPLPSRPQIDLFGAGRADTGSGNPSGDRA